MFKRRKVIAAPAFEVDDESVLIQGASGNVSNLLDVKDSANASLVSISHDGDLAVSGSITAGGNAVATESYVGTAISNLVDSAPAALDTLNELAAALNDDSSFSTTVTNALAAKAPLESPALTGTPTSPTAVFGTDSTQIATTEFVQNALDGLGLNGLLDIVITAPEEFQTLEYDGTTWVNKHASVVSYVQNAEATTLTTGTVVYLYGATGDHATVRRADNNSDATSSKTVGLVGANIAPSENGPVVTRGYVDGINLSAYSPGTILWLGENGAFTSTKPTAPDHLVFIGVVVRATNNGIVYVATQNGYELDELHNVSLPSPSAGQFLKYDGSLWVADTIDLGTDTSGNYVSDITAGTGVTVTHTPSEGSSPTVAIGQAVGTTSNVTFNDVNISGKASINSSSGDEGGEIFLNKPQTNTSISGGVTVDVYQNKLRFFEQTGSNRGAYIDLTNAGNAASTNLLAQPGSVIQTVIGTKSDSFITSSTGFVDVTGYSVTITPKFSSSKILVQVSMNIGASYGTNMAYARLVRNSTVIAVGDASGSRAQVSVAAEPNTNSMAQASIQFLDSPATTSPVTYKIQISTNGAGFAAINRSIDDSDAYGRPRGFSSITVMEIAV